jgi:hypothetical protein
VVVRSRIAVVLLAAGVLLGVVAIPAVAASPAPRAGTPSNPASRDLTSYALFGFSSLAFKGTNGPGHGNIRGGNVGSNGPVSICQNGGATMDDGTQLVGASVDGTNTGCTIWDLYTNSLTGNPKIVPRNSGPTPVSVPVITAPTLPSFSCDANNPLTVVKGQTGSLVPGVYGAVEFQDNTTVTLQDGTYTMCSLHTGQDVRVTLGPRTVLQIAGSFILSNGTTFGQAAACAVPVYVRADGVSSNDNAINFAKNTHVFGRFLTPLGKIALGNGTDLNGAFWGDRIISDFDVDVTQCPAQTGQFPIVKSIVGSGAGLQGPIEIQVTCTPPNGSIPPFTIPGGATGNISTVVTGITVPATCHVSEVNTGENPNVDIDVTIVGGNAAAGVGAQNLQSAPGADVPVCPVAAPLKQTRRSRANENGAVVINNVETTTTSTSSTSTTTTLPTTTTTGESTTTTAGESTTTTTESTTTTTEPTTTTTLVTTTTAGGTTTSAVGPTTTTGSTTVTTAATTTAATTAPTTTATGETTTTVSRETIPPDCTVPPIVSPTEVLPATGSSGVSPMVLLALLLGALGAVMLVVTTVRRPAD